MVRRATAALALASMLSGVNVAYAEEPAAPASSPSVTATNAPATDATAANASDAPPAAPSPPATSSSIPARAGLRHTPVSSAIAHEPLRITATIDHAELVRRALLVYRSSDGRDAEVEFERASGAAPYVAVIPEEQVHTPSLGYAIEIEDLAGKRQPVFATRDAMYTVQVNDEEADTRERQLLARVGGKRSVIAANADYVSFGESEVADPATGGATLTNVNDHYFRLEGAYTYRLLRTVSEFTIRIGIVRGSSPVSNAESRDDFDVGLNYGAPSIRFRLHDIVHLDASLLASVTEIGYSAGAGGAIHLGDVYGSELELGFEAVQVFGSRFYSRVNVATQSPFRLSAIVEATNMPHASRYGVRLLGEVSADLGAGLRAAARGGYQARDSASGGPAAGVTVAYAF